MINEFRKEYHPGRKGRFLLKIKKKAKEGGEGGLRKRYRRTERWKGRHEEEDRNGKQI